jgi:hypothetical protein
VCAARGRATETSASIRAGPIDRSDFSGAKAECELAEHVEPAAGNGAKGFLFDINVKPASGASGRHVVQAAAPETFRLPA